MEVVQPHETETIRTARPAYRKYATPAIEAAVFGELQDITGQNSVKTIGDTDPIQRDFLAVAALHIRFY
jgi:hypothetical protein